MNILTLAGCKSETDNFNDKALAFAKDGKIDREEFGQLISIVQKSSDRAFQQFKTDRNTVDRLTKISKLSPSLLTVMLQILTSKEPEDF
jgi:hypothetical protein